MVVCVCAREGLGGLFPPPVSRLPGRGLARETQLLRIDWSVLLWTGKIISPHRHNKSFELGACRQSAQVHTALLRHSPARLHAELNRKQRKKDSGIFFFICRCTCCFYSKHLCNTSVTASLLLFGCFNQLDGLELESITSKAHGLHAPCSCWTTSTRCASHCHQIQFLGKNKLGQ